MSDQELIDLLKRALGIARDAELPEAVFPTAFSAVVNRLLLEHPHDPTGALVYTPEAPPE